MNNIQTNIIINLMIEAERTHREMLYYQQNKLRMIQQLIDVISRQHNFTFHSPTNNQENNNPNTNPNNQTDSTNEPPPSFTQPDEQNHPTNNASSEDIISSLVGSIISEAYMNNMNNFVERLNERNNTQNARTNPTEQQSSEINTDTNIDTHDDLTNNTTNLFTHTSQSNVNTQNTHNLQNTRTSSNIPVNNTSLPASNQFGAMDNPFVIRYTNTFLPATHSFPIMTFPLMASSTQNQPYVPMTNQEIRRVTERNTFDEIDNPLDIDECPITQEEFEDDTDVIRLTRCNHVFCSNSILNWLTNHHTCPVCRINLR